MSIQLATLEGFGARVKERSRSKAKRSSRTIVNVAKIHALYGIDTDSPLSGWYADLKKTASKVASATISAASASGIPGIAQGADAARATGQQLEAAGLIPAALRTGSAANPRSGQPVTPATTNFVGGLPTWILPSLLGFGIVFLVRKAKR